MSSDPFAAARLVVEQGLADRAFPAAVVDAGDRNGARWQSAFGRLTYDESAPACTVETMFDLASLTKVIATSSIAMAHVEGGRLRLDSPVSEFMTGWRDGDRAAVTVRHLLDHSSGLPAHLRAWNEASGRAQYERLIAATPLERAVGSSAVYSDVGFMLLGLLLETIGPATLDRQFAALFGRTLDPLQFRPQPNVYERTAPTEFDPWRGRMLCGEVHDENGAALGGVAAHAGLFGTAAAVGRFARLVLETFHKRTVLGTSEVMRTFARRSVVPGSSRALGWDTALPTSSCGRHASASAIGHTGFTGTSLWIDWERDRYAVLLTNRVHPTRANQKLVTLRPAFHDALWGQV
jgi:CubicO group peptidase (beta-lactamase class C family)